MRGLTALPLNSCLGSDEIEEEWVYIATGISTDRTDGNSIWEMWNIAGGAAAYRVGTGDWYMRNEDKWELIGVPGTDKIDVHNNAVKITSYSYWKFEEDVWIAVKGKLSRDEVIEKTEGKVIH